MTATQVDPDRLDWPDLIAEGIEARRRRDGGQWDLGDLASQVETTYGGGDLERYAEEIGVEYETLRRYKAAADAYEFGVRTPNVSWSHHERIASRDDRLEWLELGAKHGWSVRQMLTEIEAWEVSQREEEERQQELARLAAQSADLAQEVADGTLDVKAALAESAKREAQTQKERRAHEERVRRQSAELGRCLTYLDTLRFPEGRAAVIEHFDNAKSGVPKKATKESIQEAAEWLRLLAEEWS